MPSITRGPGRLKYAEPSSAKTWPRRTAVRSAYPGGRANAGPFADGLGQVEPAWHQQEHLRVHLGHRVPRGLDRRLPVGTEQLPATGAPDLLGHPVAGRERRIEPLETDDARRPSAGVAPGLDLLLDGTEPLAQRLHEVDRGVLGLGHRADRGDRVEDALDGGGLERDHRDVCVDGAGDLVDLAVAHGADAAQLLGQDEVGLGGGQRRLVQRVERGAAMDRSRDEPVDVARRRRRQVMDAPRHDRLADDLGRVVALVRDAHELIAESDGAHDLGGRREERDDAHRVAGSPWPARVRWTAGRIQRGFSSSTAARAAALSVNHVASTTV